MKILILGGNGLIGHKFMHLCSEKGQNPVGTYFSRGKKDLIKFNLLDFDKNQLLLDEINPEIVINCINLAGGVNFCEENPEIAKKMHVDGIKVIADWCRKNNREFVFISTDYVFDGSKPPYKESDKTNPLNLYGKLKLESENYIRETLTNYLIVRSTNVYGWDPETVTPNFLMFVYENLVEGKSMNVPSFLYGNPTYAEDLVKAILELIEKRCYGLYHVVGSDYINRYDWAVDFCKTVGLDHNLLKKIEKVPEMAVARPLKSHLNTEKVRKIIDTKLHNVNDGLLLFWKDMKTRPKQ